MGRKKTIDDQLQKLHELNREAFWRDLGPLHKVNFENAGIRCTQDLENMTVSTFSFRTGYQERGIRSISYKLSMFGLSFKESTVEPMTCISWKRVR